MPDLRKRGMMPINAGGRDFDDIRDELSDAEKYWGKWESTRDAMFKVLAQDELRHAKMLLGKAHGLDADRVKHYTTLHDQMSARLSSAAPHGM